MWIEFNAAAILFLAVGGILLGLLAYKRGLNPWVWGVISVAALFLALLLPLNGLIALFLGAAAMSVAIVMASDR